MSEALVPVEAVPIPEPATPSQGLALLGFGTTPEQIIDYASRVATKLSEIVEARGLFKQIGDKKHLLVEAWTTQTAMLGVVPRVKADRKIERSDGAYGYEAEIELVHVASGTLISSAKSSAWSTERNMDRNGQDRGPKPWTREEFSVQSMAQTRATGKACRLAFSWIVVLKGYAGTPAEEMPEEVRGSQPEGPPPMPAGLSGTPDTYVLQCGRDRGKTITQIGHSAALASLGYWGSVIKKEGKELSGRARADHQALTYYKAWREGKVRAEAKAPPASAAGPADDPGWVGEPVGGDASFNPDEYEAAGGPQ